MHALYMLVLMVFVVMMPFGNTHITLMCIIGWAAF